MDKVALSVAGKPCRALDDADLARVFDPMGDEFVRTLSVEELETFLAELESAMTALTA
jgi:hypothetical protein